MKTTKPIEQLIYETEIFEGNKRAEDYILSSLEQMLHEKVQYNEKLLQDERECQQEIDVLRGIMNEASIAGVSYTAKHGTGKAETDDAQSLRVRRIEAERLYLESSVDQVKLKMRRCYTLNKWNQKLISHLVGQYENILVEGDEQTGAGAKDGYLKEAVQSLYSSVIARIGNLAHQLTELQKRKKELHGEQLALQETMESNIERYDTQECKAEKLLALKENTLDDLRKRRDALRVERLNLKEAIAQVRLAVSEPSESVEAE